jgi:hypothetical protein
MEYFKFNFYNQSFQQLIKLIFSFDIKSIYKEYYVLASKNINPNYIDNLSVSERMVFCSLFKEEVKSLEEGNSLQGKTGSSTGLQSLIDEFGG